MVIATQHVGVTRSSKAILQPIKTDSNNLKEITLEYSMRDHFDAYAVFQYLLSRELANIGRDSPRIEVFNEVSYFHSRQLGLKEILAQMNSLELTTIFDVIDFGKSRVDAIFV